MAAPGVCDPAEIAVMDETAARVREAVRGLSPRQRAALVLHHVHGARVAEIAAVLGVPPGTVKWLLHEARSRLRPALTDLSSTVLPSALRRVARQMAMSRETMEALVASMEPYRRVGWLLPDRARTGRSLVLLWYWPLLAAGRGDVEDAWGDVPALAVVARREEAFREGRRVWTQEYNGRPPRTEAELAALDRAFSGTIIRGHGLEDGAGALASALAESHRRRSGGVHADVREALLKLRGRQDGPVVALMAPPDAFQLRFYADCGLLDIVDAVAPISGSFGGRMSHNAEEAAERYREMAAAFGVGAEACAVVTDFGWYAPYLKGIALAGMRGLLVDRQGFAAGERGRAHFAEAGWDGPVVSDLAGLPRWWEAGA